MNARRRSRRGLRWLALIVLLFAAFVGKGYWNATREPIVRTAEIAVPDWPAGQPPLTVLHLSDTHVAGPDMPPSRLVHIVANLNRLKPDIILIAGDLISDKRLATRHYTAEEVVAPLGGFKAPLGVVVVPGNHDHKFEPDALRGVMERHGLRVLQNQAAKIGPLIVGGVDDDYSGYDDVPATLAAMDALGPGVPVMLTHSPDIVPDISRRVAAVFAGHTHCGQLRFPVIGAFTYVSRYGARFGCGDMTDAQRGQRLFVGAGLGTSVVPLRYGAPPDVWLVTLGPPKR